jgi:hypothetical protein
MSNSNLGAYACMVRVYCEWTRLLHYCASITFRFSTERGARTGQGQEWELPESRSKLLPPYPDAKLNRAQNSQDCSGSIGWRPFFFVRVPSRSHSSHNCIETNIWTSWLIQATEQHIDGCTWTSFGKTETGERIRGPPRHTCYGSIDMNAHRTMPLPRQRSVIAQGGAASNTVSAPSLLLTGQRQLLINTACNLCFRQVKQPYVCVPNVSGMVDSAAAREQMSTYVSLSCA